MRTLAIINQKGGCGKTTTSINLTACLARLGHKTLLIDMDPQGHCAVGLAVPEDQVERTIYDALIDESLGKPVAISEIVWQIASDFDLCPSNIQLAAFEQVFSGRDGREDRLLHAIEQVKDRYEWCIVDCPPSVGLLTFNALLRVRRSGGAGGDRLLQPARPDQDAGDARGHAHAVQQGDQRARPADAV